MLRKQIGLVAAAFIAATVWVNGSLVLEYDAAVGVSDTGGLVDTWADTVIARSATPYNGDAGRRPALVSSVFASGQPGLQFDANTDLAQRDILIFGDGGLPAGTDDFSIVTAVRLNNLEQGSNLRPTWFAYGAQGGGPFHTAAVAVDRPVGGNDLLFRMNGTDVHSGLTMNTGENYVTLITRSGDDYTLDLMDQNGTTSFSDTNPSLALILTQGKIGNLVAPPHGDFAEAALDGYVGLIQVYNTALTPSERTALLGQLNPFVVIPEPSMLGMLALGMSLLIRRRLLRA